MNAMLVLAPDRAFDALSMALSAAGWVSLPQTSDSIIPGEPEHALFERGSTHLAYGFNPVCRLRLLEVPLDLDHETIALLPVQSVDDVKTWLMSADERTQLRGILAAAHLPHQELLAGVGRSMRCDRAIVNARAPHAARITARLTVMFAVRVARYETTTPPTLCSSPRTADVQAAEARARRSATAVPSGSICPTPRT